LIELSAGMRAVLQEEAKILLAEVAKFLGPLMEQKWLKESGRRSCTCA
jgi:hypothetical protein